MAEEQVGGSGWRNYGADALGSIRTTFDSARALQNQYWYTPYGSNLANSGSGGDPGFRWCGSLGYCSTNLPFSQSYVRGRHYEFSTGSWTTKDSLWPRESSYGYASQNPATSVDPTGLLSCEYSKEPYQPIGNIGSCSQWEWDVHSVPDSGTQEIDGWIVQEVRMFFEGDNCPGTIYSVEQHHYWEAWQVASGTVKDPCAPGEVEYYSDSFITKDWGSCNSGENTINGDAAFFPGKEPPAGLACHVVKWAGGLMSSWNPPKGWSAGTVQHSLDVTWGCCCAGQEYVGCPKGPYSLPKPTHEGCKYKPQP